MNFNIIRNYIGKILILIGVLMLIPLITAFIYQEAILNIFSYLIPMAALIIIGGFLGYFRPAKNKYMGAREGFIIVALSWLLMALFGCLPLIISGYVTDFFTAFFEMTSGFTTTGASAITEEQLSNMLNNGGHSLLMWRSFSHWIGGMGILVFILAFIMESNEGSSISVLRAESPGPQVGKIVSKMKVSSRIMYLIYVALTFMELMALNVCHIWDSNMNFFDSVIMTFGTAGTGGFALTPASAGLYAPCSQYVIAIFMIIFGINFNVYFWIMARNFKEIYKNEELRWYLIVIFVFVFIITLQIHNLYSCFEEGFRHAFFTVASIISTTGFSTTDYWSGTQGTWPALSLGCIVVLMICGACAGSTAGGLKQSRVLILGKYVKKRVNLMISPRRVVLVRLNGKSVEKEVVDSTIAFFIIYIVVIGVCSLLISVWNPAMSAEDANPLTMLTASISCISNIGPGLGAVGPAGGFSNFSWFSKLVLSFEMIAGRLELYPILILFSRATWKRST